MTGQRFSPLNLGDIFDEGFDLYKKNFSHLLLVNSLFVLTGLVAQHLYENRPNGFDVAAYAFGFLSDDNPYYVYRWLAELVYNNLPTTIALILSVSALTVSAASRYLEHPLSLGAVLIELLKRSPKLLLNLCAVVVLIAVGYIFCFIGAVPFFVLSLFTVPAVMLEKTGWPFGAVRRSFALNKGHGLRTAGCLILLALLYYVLKISITSPFEAFVTYLINTIPGISSLPGAAAFGGGVAATDPEIATVGAAFGNLIILPFLISVLIVYYYDLRVRNEAYDVDLLAQRLNYPPLSRIPNYLPAAVPPSPLAQQKVKQRWGKKNKP